MLKKTLLITVLLCFLGEPVLDFAAEIFDWETDCVGLFAEDEGKKDSELDGEEDVDDKEVDKNVPAFKQKSNLDEDAKLNLHSLSMIDPYELFLGVLDPPPELS